MALTPYFEKGTIDLVGGSALVKDCQKFTSDIPPANNCFYQNFSGSTVVVQPLPWKVDESSDQYSKRAFKNIVVATKFHELLLDIPLDAEEDDRMNVWQRDELFDSTATLHTIIDAGRDQFGVRAFKILAKIKDFPAVLSNESTFSFGLQTVVNNSSFQEPAPRYYWQVNDNILVENDCLQFVDFTDDLENAWLRCHGVDDIFEFLLFIDFNENCLRFGLNDYVFANKIMFPRDESYELRVDFSDTCDGLLVLEAFNKPKTLKEICCQHLLNMYEQQADEIFGEQWPDQFAKDLVDKFYFEHSDGEEERNPLLTARKSLLEVFRITQYPAEEVIMKKPQF